MPTDLTDEQRGELVSVRTIAIGGVMLTIAGAEDGVDPVDQVLASVAACLIHAIGGLAAVRGYEFGGEERDVVCRNARAAATEAILRELREGAGRRN